MGKALVSWQPIRCHLATNHNLSWYRIGQVTTNQLPSYNTLPCLERLEESDQQVVSIWLNWPMMDINEVKLINSQLNIISPNHWPMKFNITQWVYGFVTIVTICKHKCHKRRKKHLHKITQGNGPIRSMHSIHFRLLALNKPVIL